jgi:transposase
MNIYPTDLTDSQWQVIQNIQNDNRKRDYDLRKIWNGIFYLLSSGCQWRMFPLEYAPWSVVYYYFKR